MAASTKLDYGAMQNMTDAKKVSYWKKFLLSMAKQVSYSTVVLYIGIMEVKDFLP